MPKGIKKQINYTEELEQIEARILYHTNTIKKLKEKKEELKKQKRIEELTTLDNFLVTHNLLPTDIITLCSAQSNKNVFELKTS